ncbi:hypothetical protein BaRGS_00008786 [Batillaria attramentaria]|uniref:Uncharacterized protein n=1 Tax=Batillaria attramentaria TaxID=370345 RepID=A0ABD0LLP6_9CAEN
MDQESPMFSSFRFPSSMMSSFRFPSSLLGLQRAWRCNELVQWPVTDRTLRVASHNPSRGLSPVQIRTVHSVFFIHAAKAED